ncbi:putative serine/threonine-protein kinase pix13 [Quercus suber]|uniref:Serine/threonine-protein kinase pix13 n=1 Tax=Quercus suber TaxID=58331 RepID=A0AAW0KXI8_QUESU
MAPGSGYYPPIISNTTSSKGSNISTKSQFSAASGDEAYPNGQILPTPNLRIFNFIELKVATKNFRHDTVLGEGGFRQVFKGWLEDKGHSKSGNGMVIAVKKLNFPEFAGISGVAVALLLASCESIYASQLNFYYASCCYIYHCLFLFNKKFITPTTHGLIICRENIVPQLYNNASHAIHGVLAITIDALLKVSLTSLTLALMDPIILLVLASLFTHPLSLIFQPTNPISRITVVGVVYCDICSSNTFSRHSYFLLGADVQIQCNFKANSPKTTEQITFSVNRTTNKHGVYNLEIPTVDGVNYVEGLVVTTLCQVSLIRSSSLAWKVPVLKTMSNVIIVKSKQDNLCIYNLNALSYRPSKKNATLCGNQQEFSRSLNASKFLPYFPPYGFPLPPLPQFPFPPLPPLPPLPFPPLPPFSSLPFPPLPTFPSLPFPFPRLPPFPPTLSQTQELGYLIFYSLSPPPPPTFNLGDPKTWIPYIPPSPSNNPQNQNP